MAAYLSSSLAASDKHDLTRHNGSGLLKNLSIRMSKQHMSEHKMFGGRRGRHGKDFKIGKKFDKKGKGIVKSYHDGEEMSSHSISPSIDEFDSMMNNVSGGFSNNKKKKLFSRKQFG